MPHATCPSLAVTCWKIMNNFRDAACREKVNTIPAHLAGVWGVPVRYNFRHPTDVFPPPVRECRSPTRPETEAIAPACKTIAGNFSLRMSPPAAAAAAAACELTMNIHSECLVTGVSVLEQRVRALTFGTKVFDGLLSLLWQGVTQLPTTSNRHQTSDTSRIDFLPPPAEFMPHVPEINSRSPQP